MSNMFGARFFHLVKIMRCLGIWCVEVTFKVLQNEDILYSPKCVWYIRSKVVESGNTCNYSLYFIHTCRQNVLTSPLIQNPLRFYAWYLSTMNANKKIEHLVCIFIISLVKFAFHAHFFSNGTVNASCRLRCVRTFSLHTWSDNTSGWHVSDMSLSCKTATSFCLKSIID